MIHRRDRESTKGLRLFKPKIRKAIKCYKGIIFKKMVAILSDYDFYWLHRGY